MEEDGGHLYGEVGENVCVWGGVCGCYLSPILFITKTGTDMESELPNLITRSLTLFKQTHTFLYILTLTLSTSIFHDIASVPPFRYTHTHTYVSIKCRLSMMNVATF